MDGKVKRYAQKCQKCGALMEPHYRVTAADTNDPAKGNVLACVQCLEIEAQIRKRGR